MKGIEPIMDRFKAILVAELDARLTLLDAEYDDWTLPSIGGVFIEGGEFAIDWPNIYLFEVDPTIVHFTSTSAFDYVLDVVVWDQCDAEGMERMHRRLWRYRRAIQEVMLQSHQVEEGYWHNLLLHSVIPSPVFQVEKTDVYRKAKALRFVLQVVEQD